MTAALIAGLLRSFSGRDTFSSMPPRGHLVFKAAVGARLMFDTTSTVTTRSSGQPPRVFAQNTTTLIQPVTVQHGVAECLYQRTITFPDATGARAEKELYRVTRSPYGVYSHWRILSGNVESATANDDVPLAPELPLIDLDNLPLIFPQRALTPGDAWTIDGHTTFRHRRAMLQGSYTIHFRWKGTERKDGQSCLAITARYAIACPMQPLAGGKMSLRETSDATLWFDTETAELFASVFTTDRQLTGEWRGTPYRTRTHASGTMKRITEHGAFSATPEETP